MPTPVPPHDELDIITDFARIRDRMAGDLERLRFYAERVGLDEGDRAEIDRVLERSRRNTFTVAVVGEFKRGKSTFINALLGRSVLPTDDLPCSAALNRVQYGPQPAAQVIFKGGAGEPERSETVALEELVEYVTKLTEESEARAATVKQATVFYPLPFLEQNEIIDTPGLNDSPEMTEVTYGVLHEVDAAIMVVMPQAPFGKTEADFLNYLLAHDVGRIMFVVNRMDQVRREPDRARIIAEIETRIRESTDRKAAELYGADSDNYRRYLQRIGAIKVFGLSARQALTARESEPLDSELFERSGFGAFERHLRQFLAGQRGSVKLRIVAERLLSSGAKVLQTLSVRAGALEMTQEEFDRAYAESSARLDEATTQLNRQFEQLTEVAERTRKRARALVGQLGPNLKTAASAVIDELEISVADLEPKRFRALQRRMGAQVSEAVASAGQLNAERVQLLIQQELQIVTEQLEEVALSTSELLRAVTARFAGDQELPAPSFGNLRFGGNGAMLAGGVLALAALGLAVAWPVVLVLSVASVFNRTWVLRGIDALAFKQIEQFREQYRRVVHEAIDLRLAEHGLEIQEQCDAHVRATFEALRQRASQEIGGSVEHMRRVVDELRTDRAVSRAQVERDQSELAQIRADAERMLADTRAVAEQIDHLLEHPFSSE